MPKRLICTPDAEPWENITIPLVAWGENSVKVEVVLTANGWWYEFPFLARLEIGEGSGREKFISAAKATVNGYTWSYRVDNGEATIVAEKNGDFPCAVSPRPQGDVSIPAELDGFKVTRIGRCAFTGCSELSSVTIPKDVSSIGWCAFIRCRGLTLVLIPSGMKWIERGAFAHCRALTSVQIPESVTDIGIDAFLDCGRLKSVTLPKGMKVIKTGVFSQCSGLTSVSIPKGVETIKRSAFSWYCGIENVSIPASVTNIEPGAFIDCPKLKSFSVDPANPCYRTTSGLLCFKDGSRLVAGVNGDVTIPAGVTTIGIDAFHGCFGLKTVSIPSSVTNVEHWAFSFLKELASVRVDDANRFYKSVNGMLLTKDGTVLVRGVNRGSAAIPSGVTSIGDASFSCCRESSVTIPPTVKNIDSNAFVNADEALTSVTMLGERPNAPNDVFKSCDKLKEIHVPANAKSWAGMTEWQGKKLVFDAK